jgi:quinol monooxygenase YgiN
MIRAKALSISCLLASALFSIGGTTVHAADEPVVVIARFFVNPGQEAVFEERNLKVVEFVRKAEPDVIYRLQRSTTNPSQYVFYEVYPSQAAFDRHVKDTIPAVAKEVGPRPEGMLARPPETEKLVPLGR